MTSKKKSAASTSASPATRGTASAAKQAPAPALAPQPTPAQLQLKVFDEAVRLFSQKKFADALPRFEEVSRGPAPHVADKARSYLQMCSRKVADHSPNLQSAEDYFNYGVERLNARDIEQARLQLTKALALEPNGEHILYTLALACGLAGDSDGACENLRRAIELEPKNRILARQDPEFSALAQQIPPLKSLLQPESSSPF